jgi:hypothetical protein
MLGDHADEQQTATGPAVLFVWRYGYSYGS